MVVGNGISYSMDAIGTLDVRQQAFMDWLCTPSVGRVPSSQAQYAKTMGVDETTLRRWKAKPSFKAEWNRRVNDAQASPERTQHLLDSLYQRGMDGDNNSAKLYLQATGRLAPVQLEVAHKGSVVDLSDIELAELIATTARTEQSFRLESVQVVSNGNN